MSANDLVIWFRSNLWFTLAEATTFSMLMRALVCGKKMIQKILFPAGIYAKKEGGKVSIFPNNFNPSTNTNSLDSFFDRYRETISVMVNDVSEALGELTFCPYRDPSGNVVIKRRPSKVTDFCLILLQRPHLLRHQHVHI